MLSAINLDEDIFEGVEQFSDFELKWQKKLEYEHELMIEERMRNQGEEDVLKPKSKPTSGLGAEIKTEE